MQMKVIPLIKLLALDNSNSYPEHIFIQMLTDNCHRLGSPKK